MKCYNLFLTTISLILLASCSSQKQVSYFQDIQFENNESRHVQLATLNEIKIQPHDKLSILVNSQDPRLSNLFNLPIVLQQVGIESQKGTSYGLSGYVVDSNGNINFPILGELHISGLTREEVQSLIKKELQSKDLIKDPVITVEFLNLNIAVLGEVLHPGRYSIDKDHFTILDALSLAGDLTIYGKRDRVLVMRSVNGEQQIYNIDLCSAEKLYSSPVYYLQQNDVVYVEPNDTKIRQSTVNGNNIRSTSFWISIASLLTTITVLFVK